MDVLREKRLGVTEYVVAGRREKRRKSSIYLPFLFIAEATFSVGKIRF